jgi:acyl-CoA synthetase (AMP-forming)/AMP-acid ligase II
VHQAAAFEVRGTHGEGCIAAALIPHPNVALEAEVLRRHLAERLPAYALPAHIELRSSFPTTTSGTIDRLALAAASQAAGDAAAAASGTAAVQ